MFIKWLINLDENRKILIKKRIQPASQIRIQKNIQDSSCESENLGDLLYSLIPKSKKEISFLKQNDITFILYHYICFYRK
jgi:hypothetical protein